MRSLTYTAKFLALGGCHNISAFCEALICLLARPATAPDTQRIDIAMNGVVLCWLFLGTSRAWVGQNACSLLKQSHPAYRPSLLSFHVDCVNQIRWQLRIASLPATSWANVHWHNHFPRCIYYVSTCIYSLVCHASLHLDWHALFRRKRSRCKALLQYQ